MKYSNFFIIRPMLAKNKDHSKIKIKISKQIRKDWCKDRYLLFRLGSKINIIPLQEIIEILSLIQTSG